jgi:hypothetical protein
MIMSDKYSRILGRWWRQEVENSTVRFLMGYRDYLRARGERMSPPYSVERMATEYLGLGLDIRPIRDRFPDIPLDPDDSFLGALNWDPDSSEWTIYLDQGLEEGSHEGRINFTMAHELAHYLLDLTDQEKALGSETERIAEAGSNGPRIFCRTSDSEEPIERRADYAAACLLAPSSTVKARSKEWAIRHGFVTGGCSQAHG